MAGRRVLWFPAASLGLSTSWAWRPPKTLLEMVEILICLLLCLDVHSVMDKVAGHVVDVKGRYGVLPRLLFPPPETHAR